MTETQHDDMLFEMLKNCKTLPVFLDQVFGFLNRRTDFYHVAPDDKSPVGLPEGYAETLVKRAFFKNKPQPIVFPEDCIPVEGVEEVITSQLDELKVSTPPDKETIFTSSDSYNGAAFETYCWTQNISELDILVQVPPDLQTKNLLVEIKPNSIQIQVKSTKENLLNGELKHKIKQNETIWSLDKRKLSIHLEKVQEIWWDCLVTTEPKLDVAKIDCSRPFEELSEEAQVKIEELQWNQERKRLGLPTSEDLTMHEKLKKAWNVEGSPFSGPFDPSQVQFN